MEKKNVDIGGNSYTLLFEDFDDNIDIDTMLQINYSNLLGEAITIPMIVNRFGRLLADAESQVSECKLSLEVFEAKTKDKLRVELSEENNGKNPTVDALNNALICVPAYQKMKKRVIEAMKVRDYMNSVFWSLKDKSDKVLTLLKTADIGSEVELAEGKVNGIITNRRRKVIE